jgi:DNA-binding response OmpR family regulator
MPTPVEPPVEGVRETILLVDDDHLVRDFTREMLTRDGYTVLVARDGAEALRIAAARSEPIHLLLTDVVMPRLSGINTAARLAETHPGIRILYVSGYTDDAIFRNGVAQGEVSFLAKPFTRHELAAKVREVLDRPAGA